MNIRTEYHNLPFPNYALSYLINSDATGISDEDREATDRWAQPFYDEADACGGHVVFDANSERDSYLSPRPEFGLACDCTDLSVVVFNP